MQWDRQRERWDRARRPLYLADVNDQAFATGGIAFAADAAKETGFSLGAQIEDAFGSKLRRFTARTGPLAGEFDRGRYGWT